MARQTVRSYRKKQHFEANYTPFCASVSLPVRSSSLVPRHSNFISRYDNRPHHIQQQHFRAYILSACKAPKDSCLKLHKRYYRKKADINDLLIADNTILGILNTIKSHCLVVSVLWKASVCISNLFHLFWDKLQTYEYNPLDIVYETIYCPSKSTSLNVLYSWQHMSMNPPVLNQLLMSEGQILQETE